ncbi:MAG: penicillin acylase family protein [Ignavibacteria bacterium]|nr:penicillin acylase family protein [Ignavibacteria bacterium]
MKKILKTLTGILIITLPLLITLILIFNNLSGKSFYENSGVIKTNGLKGEVKIYFDSYGVPHIFSQSDHDAYFTMGYLHARDRLWQMDISRRAAEGRLAEILGKEVLKYDKLFRTIGINRFAYYWYRNISPLSVSILESYSQGVNRFIEDNYNNLPVEFDALSYKPEPWKPEHSLMIARMMAWELNIAWFTDWIIGSLVNKVGVEKTSEIFPDTSISLFKKENIDTNEFSLSFPSSFAADFLKLNLDFRNYFGISLSHTGSNSWVVSSAKSAYGKPILCNDPHLFLSAPSKWYELHVKSDSLDARGMSIAGVPGIVIGNNRHIAWGLTNLMCDDNDFVILRRDSSESRKYIWGGKSHYPDSLIEKIFVKDSGEVLLTVRQTLAGTLISDVDLNGIDGFNYRQRDELIAFRWTGFELSDEVLCFYRINKSSDWKSFRDALKYFCAPAQNFLYADTNGNIGYQCAGKIPIRNTDDPNNFMYPTEFELTWKGFIDFEKLPSLFNTSEEYILTANTDPAEWIKNQDYNFYISYLWEPSSRFNRINEFLSKQVLIDNDECALLQNDPNSPYARMLATYITEAYKDVNEADQRVNWCLGKFSQFNGELKSDESIPSVYGAFLVFLIKNTFEDELGKDVFNNFITVQNILTVHWRE